MLMYSAESRWLTEVRTGDRFCTHFYFYFTFLLSEIESSPFDKCHYNCDIYYNSVVFMRYDSLRQKKRS